MLFLDKKFIKKVQEMNTFQYQTFIKYMYKKYILKVSPLFKYHGVTHTLTTCNLAPKFKRSTSYNIFSFIKKWLTKKLF